MHTTIRLSQAIQCVDYEDRLADAHRNSEPEIVAYTIDDGLRAAVRIAEDNAPWDVCLFKEHRHDRPRATAGSPLLPRRVARLGLLVHGIEAGKLRPPLDLRDDKALHALVLGALLGDEGEKVLRDHRGSVVAADDDIAGKDRAAAAADRLLPSDEGEAIDVGRGGSAGAPHRQLGGKHALLVAHHAVGH